TGAARSTTASPRLATRPSPGTRTLTSAGKPPCPAAAAPPRSSGAIRSSSPPPSRPTASPAPTNCPRWTRASRSAPSRPRPTTRLGWGEAVTPVVHGDALLLNLDQEEGSALVCLDARTGATRWKAARDEHTTWSTPLVVEHAGRAQVVANGTKRIRGYDLET